MPNKQEITDMRALQQWAGSVVTRLKEQIDHTKEMVDTQMQYQNKLIQQEIQHLTTQQAEKYLNLSVKLDEFTHDLRAKQDTLLKEFSVLERSVSQAHNRLDGIEGEQAELKTALEEHAEVVENLVRANEDAQLSKEAIKKDPVRKFFVSNGKTILSIIITAAVVAFIAYLFPFLKDFM